MNSTAVRLSLCAIACCGLALLASTSPALALPVGDTYVFTGYNLPDDNGPTNITVDGTPQNSGGLSVNETVAAWNGVPNSLLIKRTGKADINNTDFSKVGQIFQFDLVRNSAGLLSDDPAAGFGFSVADLDFGGPINLLDSTIYFYFTDSNNNPIALTPTIKFLSYWGPNPLNLAQEVLYTTSVEDLGDFTNFPDGKVSFDLAPSASVTVNLLATALGNPDVHGIHIGSLYTVPEPSSLVLAASGVALALVGARRARRRHA